jgi:hypothetical protein
MSTALQLVRLSPARPRTAPHGGASFSNGQLIETRYSSYVLNNSFHNRASARGTRASDGSLSGRVLPCLTTSQARLRPIPHGGAFFFSGELFETKYSICVLNNFLHSWASVTGTRASDSSMSGQVLPRLTTCQARLHPIPHGGAFFSNIQVLETEYSSDVLNNYFHRMSVAASQ